MSSARCPQSAPAPPPAPAPPAATLSGVPSLRSLTAGPAPLLREDEQCPNCPSQNEVEVTVQGQGGRKEPRPGPSALFLLPGMLTRSLPEPPETPTGYLGSRTVALPSLLVCQPRGLAQDPLSPGIGSLSCTAPFVPPTFSDVVSWPHTEDKTNCSLKPQAMWECGGGVGVVIEAAGTPGSHLAGPPRGLCPSRPLLCGLGTGPGADIWLLRPQAPPVPPTPLCTTASAPTFASSPLAQCSPSPAMTPLLDRGARPPPASAGPPA